MPIPIRILLVTLLALTVYGCGIQNEDTPAGPPIPDTPKEHQGPGTPLFIFGSGNRLRGFQTEDEEYREYLIWKEWQEYQNFLKWKQSQERSGASRESNQSE